MKRFNTLFALFAIALVASNAYAFDAPSVYVDQLDMSELEIKSPPGHSLKSRDFELTAEEQAGLSELYRSSVAKALSRKDEFVIVENAEQADYVVRGSLLELAPNAPKDDRQSREMGARYITQGAGRAEIAIEIYSGDALVGEYQDSRDAGYGWGENDRFNNKHDFKRMFYAWGKQVSKIIDKI